MHEDGGVGVGVDDAGVGGVPLGDLVGVLGGGQSAADVEELPDADVAGEVAHRAAEELAGGHRDAGDARVLLAQRVAEFLVHGVPVLTPEPVVPEARRVRHGRVDFERNGVLGVVGRAHGCLLGK